MLSALAIAQNDLRCYAKNRMAIFWTFLGPALCMWLFGYLTPSGSALPAVSIITDRSAGHVVQKLASELRENGHAVTITDHPPASGTWIELREISSGSTIPSVTLHAGGVETEFERSLYYEIEAASAASSNGSADTAVTGLSLKLPPRLQRSAGFQRTVPAYLIMFLTMNLLVTGGAFSEERASGRMRRLLTAPVTALTIVLGRLASRLVIAWLQMLVLFSIGVFVLHIHWAQHGIGVILLLSAYVLTMGSIGMLIGTYFTDPDQASAFAMWSALILAPLTGLWWPIELMPSFLQTLAHSLPTGWVMQSVDSMLTNGSSINHYPITLPGLIAVAALAIMLSLRRLSNSPA